MRISSKIDKSKDTKNTNEPQNKQQQDWKVLNVGIFSIQMTDGPEGVAGGLCNVKSASKGTALIMSRTPPFLSQSNGNNASCVI